MTNIDQEIALSSLHDLILWVFGRDQASDRNLGHGSEATTGIVECSANQKSLGETK
jgi:hypothetical protein